MLVIASFRSDELDRRHPLRRLQADLEGDPRTRRIVLRPLERDELADQLADILGAAPAPELLDRLWARTGGNPLFGEELLTAGADGRGAAPDTLRDALMLRVERLSSPARDVLALVAVGERLDHATLARTTGLARGELRDALREAVDRHVLVADDDGRHRFRHALLREAVEHDLLPGERAELHLTLARALEEAAGERVDAPGAAAVAHHFAAAGADEDALRSAVRAASAAERVHAHGEAAALLERALGLWNQVPDPAAPSGADRAELLVRAAEAAGALGEPERRLGLLEEALADLGPDPDPARAARILESIATAQRHLNRNAASIATLEHALDLVSGTADGDAAVRADLLAGLARALGIAGRSADAARLASEALALATRLGRPLVESSARNTLGHAVAMEGAVDAGVADLRESIRIAREHDSPLDVALGHINLADALHALGRSAEAREVAEEGRRAIAGRRPIATRWIDVMLAEIAVDTGDWDGAEARLPAGPADPGEQTRLGLELRRAALALGRGDDAAAGVVLAANRAARRDVRRAAGARAARGADGRGAPPRR